MIFLERSKNIDKRIEECEYSLTKINEELSFKLGSLFFYKIPVQFLSQIYEIKKS